MHARTTPAEKRRDIARVWAQSAPPGSVLVSTCHRVELYGSAAALDRAGLAIDTGVRALDGVDAMRHLVTLAVGRDSTVLGEDQILHQLRLAVQEARRQGTAPGLDRAFDLALRAGRVARSWLPANRPTLLEVALDGLGGDVSLDGARVHVAGSGEMGRRALVALLRRGALATISSRSRENARAVGSRHGVADLQFDPGPEVIRSVSGFVIALNGRWPLSALSRAALLGSRAWVVDLSSPSALQTELVGGLGVRAVVIDDLAARRVSTSSARTIARLDALIERTVADFERWAADDGQRSAAEALTRRAYLAKTVELDRLWRRAPTLDDEQRAQVERAIEHLTERILREPLEQLSRDRDGNHARAVRELFRL